MPSLRQLTAGALLAGVAAAWPQENKCSVEKSILSSLHADPIATSFCSKYLSIHTHTCTKTKTVTGLPVTITTASTTTAPVVPLTSTVETDTFTATSIVTAPVTTIPTITIPITIPTTITTTTTSIATVPTCDAESGSNQLDKRSVARATPDCLRPHPASIISKACSCLSIPTPSTTVSKTVTVPGLTNTLTNLATITPTVTSDVTLDVTVTTVVTTVPTITAPTVTVTTVVTTVVTATQTATVNVVEGLSYAMYQSTYDYSAINPPIPDFSTYKTGNTITTGSVSNVADWRTLNYPTSAFCFPPDQPTNPIDCGFVAVVMQGYLVGQQAGIYILSTPAYIDNAMYVWSGDVAYSQWDNTNFDYNAVRDQQPVQGGISSYNLALGEILPITIVWINGGGPGQALLTVQTPDGASHEDSTGFFVQACNSSPFTS